jgi:hypothetical protein
MPYLDDRGALGLCLYRPTQLSIASRSETMTLKRHLPLLAILAFSNPAFAQHHPANRGVGGHPGGAAPHPGQQHPNQPQQPHHMTPEMQMWSDQMLFDQIMRSRRAASTRQGGQGQSAGMQNQPAAGQQRVGSYSSQSKINQSQDKANQQPPKTSASRGMSKQEHEKEAKTNSAATKKEGHRHDHPGQHAESRKATAASKRPLATDQAAISMLKTAQMKLSKADHDYAGHRVQAMRHVAHALDHLTGSFLFNEHAVSGFGNLAQAESDRLLREAEGHLNFIENTLRTRTNSFEHHQSARTSVTDAIRELRIALTIR